MMTRFLVALLGAVLVFGTNFADAQEQPGRVSIPLSALGETEAAALATLAQLALRSNEYEPARKLATQSYRRANKSVEKFNAALIAAQAAAASEKLTLAQVWLRRADQHAPNAEAKALVQRSYRQVSARNPFSFLGQFALGPSDNVNNGADNTTIIIGGLPFTISDSESRLGGWEGEIGATFGYRLSQERDRQTALSAQLHHRRVWLSDAAKEKAPAAEASDFESTTAVFGIQHDRIVWPELGVTNVALLGGQTWYARDPLATWVELRGRQDIKAGDNRQVRLSFSTRTEDRLGSTTQDSNGFRGGADLVWATENKKSRSVGLTFAETRASSALIDQKRFGITGVAAFGLIGPFDTQLSASLTTTDFPKWISTPQQRRDDTLDLRIDAKLPDVQYLGFVPALTLSVRTTKSNVDIYTRQEIAIGLAAQSRF